MGGHVWATPTTLTAQRQQWFTGQTAEVPESEEQLQLVIHIPEYLLTTPEDIGPNVERIVQKHDSAAAFNDSNKEGDTHQIQTMRDTQGHQNGSFKYIAPSQDLAENLQKELNLTCLTPAFCQTCPTTERHTDPRFLTPPPENPRVKNAKEGRYCGPFSSFQ